MVWGREAPCQILKHESMLPRNTSAACLSHRGGSSHRTYAPTEAGASVSAERCHRQGGKDFRPSASRWRPMFVFVSDWVKSDYHCTQGAVCASARRTAQNKAAERSEKALLSADRPPRSRGPEVGGG